MPVDSKAIRFAMEDVEIAKRGLATAVRRSQARCRHKVVVEMPFNMAYRGSTPHRICRNCGLEEEGSVWSGGSTWSREDYEDEHLGNEDGRFIIQVNTADEFYAYRVPGVPVNAEPKD